MSDGPVKVLLVEDSTADTNLIREMLFEVDGVTFDLERVERLSAGLERLSGGNVDLVLLDLSLPDSWGFDTFRKAHIWEPRVPLIVLTGLDDEAMAVRAVREGAQDYLVKGRVDGPLLVRSMRYAIERKRAEEKLRQRTAQLEALREVALEITGQLDLDDLLSSITSRAVDLVGGCSGILGIYRPEHDVVELTVYAGIDAPPEKETFHGGEGVAGRILETREPHLVSDYSRWEGRDPLWADYVGHAAIVGAPICWGDEFLGVLEIVADLPDVFSQKDADLLTLFATQAAIAIRNARLYEETSRRLAQTQVLREVMLAAVSTLDFDQVLERTYEMLETRLGVEFISFAMLNESEGNLRLHPSQIGYDGPVEDISLPLGESVAGQVYRTGEPIIIEDVRQVPYYYEGSAEVRSELAVPVRVGEDVLGVLNVESRDLNAFDQEDLAFYTTIAGQLSVALENAQLYRREQRQRQEAETLREAALALASTLERGELVERILAQLQRVVPYDTASVQLLREGKLEVVGGRGFSNLEEIVGLVFDPGREDNPNRLVVERRAPLILDNAPEAYENFQRGPHEEISIRSWLGVPMTLGNRLIGMIALDKREPHFYAEEHARLAKAFAAQAAIAVENARLFEIERRHTEEIRGLTEIIRAIDSTLDLDEVLERIATYATTLSDSNAGAVFELDAARGELHMTASCNLDRAFADAIRGSRVAVGKGAVGSAVDRRQPVQIADVQADESYAYKENMAIGGYRSILAVPMLKKGALLGGIVLLRNEPGSFSSQDVALLTTLADHAAVAVENARLHRRVQSYADRLEERVRERTAELQAQYAQLEAILHSTTDGIIVTNEHGEILQTNRVAEQWLTQTLSPGEAQKLRRAVRDLAARVEQQPQMVLELTGLDLELTVAPIAAPGIERPIRSSQEKPAAVVAIHDVSHLKALDRMKTRFVSNVSHELRTPITAINLFAQLMRQHPERWQEYLSPLSEEARHQAQLVEDILEISRMDAGRLSVSPRPVDLDRLVSLVIENQHVQAEEVGLTLEQHPASGEIAALADPKRIMQVLKNLVVNAIRYTPEGGRIELSTARKEAGGRAWATVTVQDTGMGIPEHELPHVFERFFRGEKPRLLQISGTGLGLAIVREIVELHGGRVTVESEEGEGSTFAVWLPTAATSRD